MQQRIIFLLENPMHSYARLSFPIKSAGLFYKRTFEKEVMDSYSASYIKTRNGPISFEHISKPISFQI